MSALSTAMGVYVIAPTPFEPDGRVDNESIDRMTDFFVQAAARAEVDYLLARLAKRDPRAMV